MRQLHLSISINELEYFAKGLVLKTEFAVGTKLQQTLQ